MAVKAFLDGVAASELRRVETQANPKRWEEFCRRYQLRWTYTPFERRCVIQVGDCAGVYCFHLGHSLSCLPVWGLALYGGMSNTSLRKRCRAYFGERDSSHGRPAVRKFLSVFAGELTFAWAPADPLRIDLKRLEEEMNDAMMPPYSKRDFSASVRFERGAW